MLLEWVYFQLLIHDCWHMDIPMYPLSDSGTLVPHPLISACIGQGSRIEEGHSSFCFSILLGYQEAGQTHKGFQYNFRLRPAHEGLNLEKKYEGTKKQKTS